MSLLTVNLEKKLISAKKAMIAKQMSQQEGQDSLLNQANELLENNAEGDLTLLKSVGFGNAISASRNVQYEADHKKRLLSKLNDPRIFTKDEIRTLCINYGLRFLPVKYYEGSVPSNIAAKIREAYEVNGMTIPEQDPYYRERYEPNDLGIIAPKESFRLQEKPKDPLLFLKLHDGTYYLVAKWGDDLSVMRYLYNIPCRSVSSALWTLVGLIVSFILCVVYITSAWWVLSVFALSTIAMIVYIAVYLNGEEKSNDETYDSKFE